MSSINTVLIATDLSELAKRAEMRAAMLCTERHCGSVELLTVQEAGYPDVLAQMMHNSVGSALALITEQTMRELESRSAALKDGYGMHGSCNVRFGQPAAEIVARADDIAADLVVIGAHGGNFFSDLLLGNTADRLTRLCKRPLLIVKNEPQRSYRHVLVPVDFSEDARCAAEVALKNLPQADITFLHAFEVWFEGQLQYANVPREIIDDFRVKAREQAQVNLDKFIAGLNAADRCLNRVITFGMPGAVVREHAKVMRPDLIVMGKHGRSSLAELIIGSVTRDTLEQTDSDILIVPGGAASA